jgi:hypothetical protein
MDLTTTPTVIFRVSSDYQEGCNEMTIEKFELVKPGILYQHV